MPSTQLDKPKIEHSTNIMELLQENIREFGMYIALFVIIAFFAIATDGVLDVYKRQQLARGEEPCPVSRKIHNGFKDVPFYVLEPVAVYKENMDDTIIRDRFHLADEVYINMP